MKNCRSDDIAYETAFAKKDCAKSGYLRIVEEIVA